MYLLHLILVLALPWNVISESDPWLWTGTVGGQGGAKFNFNKANYGMAVKKIEVWQGDWQLRGIRITYTDSTKALAGKEVGEYVEFKIDVAGGERVEYLAIYGNGEGSRTGGFKIKTNKGRTFFPQMTDWDLKDAYVKDEAGGMILGIYGKHSSDIDRLGFMMLKEIKSSKLTNVQYNVRALEEPSREHFFDIPCLNPSDTDSVVTGSIGSSTTKTESSTWTTTHTVAGGMDYKVSAGVPFIVKATTVDAGLEVSGHWEITNTKTTEKSTSKSRTLEWKLPVICPKRSKYHYNYYYYEGHADIKFSGMMNIVVDGGDVWKFKVTGNYEGNSISQVRGTSELRARYINDRWVPV